MGRGVPKAIPAHQKHKALARHQVYLRWHLATYFGVLALWALAIIFRIGDWSVFWPIITWSLAIMVHYLVARSIDVDPKWIEERTNRVTDDAKDTSHIENIRDHYVRGIRPKTRASHPPSKTKKAQINSPGKL